MKFGTTAFCAVTALCLMGLLPAPTSNASASELSPAETASSAAEAHPLPSDSAAPGAEAAPDVAESGTTGEEICGADKVGSENFEAAENSDVTLVGNGMFEGARVPRPKLLEIAAPEGMFSEPYECARKALTSPKGRDAGGAAALKCIGEVQPASVHERYLKAVALLRTGAAAEAVPLFSGLAEEHPNLADRCRWSAGRSFAARGQEVRAFENFKAISKSSSLADDAALAAAAALRRMRRLDEALLMLEPLASRPCGRWGRDISAEAIYARAEIQRQQGHRRAAAASFLEVWSRHPRSHLAAPALKAAEDLKIPPSFEDSVKRAESLADIQKNEAALNVALPLLKKLPEKADPQTVCLLRSVAGRSLRKMRKFKEAVEMLDPVVEGCQPSHSWAASLYTLGQAASGIDSDAALSAYQKLASRMPESDLADDALFLAAGIFERRGNLDRARHLLRRVVLLHEGGDHRAEALFHLAWISRKSGRLKDARTAFSQLESEYADSDPESSIRAGYWKARVLEEMGLQKEAEEALSDLVEKHPAGFYPLMARTRLKAWKDESASSEEAASSPAVESTETSQSASKSEENPSSDSPVDFSVPDAGAFEAASASAAVNSDAGAASEEDAGHLPEAAEARNAEALASAAGTPDSAALPSSHGAATSSAEQQPAPPPRKKEKKKYSDGLASAKALWTRALTDDPQFTDAVELLSMGFTDDGIQELLKIDRTHLRYPAPPDDLMTLSVLLARNGERRRAHVIARNDLRGLFYGIPDEDHILIWKVSWPELFRELIETHAEDAKLDPDLLQALVREESAFNPTAGSWVGAMGLCQLMMPTAREVAGWLKIQGKITKERLHEPDLNLRMGATYLSRLIRQFKGNTALAVAAYNAGAGAVRRFLGRYSGEELDEFVETIPFEETRNYVKRVLGSMATYQLIYGRVPTPTLDCGVKIRREDL